jgi:hypothetical protein
MLLRSKKSTNYFQTIEEPNFVVYNSSCAVGIGKIKVKAFMTAMI